MKKPRILIAEDERIVARDIAGQLAGLGYEVVGSTGFAEQAIVLAGELRPDLVLMDVHLAGPLDGITAAEAIAARFALPVVFLTAYAGGETLTRAKLAEPYGYVVKPFTERDLHTSIEIALYKHEVETSRRQAERVFHTFFDAMSDAAVIWSPEGSIDCNQAAVQLFGCASKEEFLAINPQDFSPPSQPDGSDSRTGRAAIMARARAEGSAGAEWVLRRWDTGALVHVESRVISLQLDGRAVFQSVIREIGVQKRTEKELEASRQMLEAVIENMPATLVIKGAKDLRYEMVNRGAEAFLGRSRADLIGATDRNLFPETQSAARLAADRAALAGSGTIDPSESLVLANGEARQFLSKRVVLRDETGEPSHLLAISLDVTEHWKILQELVAARDEAERANQAKSQFLSSMSHEIRTPLNGILGMADLLLGTPLSADQTKYCQAIAGSGATLHSLLSNILDLAKIEAEKVELERVAFDLAPMLRDIDLIFSGLAAARGVTLSLAIDLPSRRVLGDPTRLRQVLMNLVSNAIKFTERGRVQVAASVAATEGAFAPGLRFIIEDTGVGMDARHLSRLFEPFSQADASTARQHGGTGLGLAITKHLVDLMGGSIVCESQVGVGSRFCVDLPLDLVAGGELSDLPKDTPLSAQSPLRVLLAEDSAINQEVVRIMLQTAGIDVVTVENGEEAVGALANGIFDLVLMDCQMPVVNGYDATRRIRASEGLGRRVPIIALTADAFAEDRIRCLEAGMDDFLTKPVRRDVLLRAVVTGASRIGRV